MKKLFMIAMAAVFSVSMVSAGYASSTTTTAPADKKEEKKADAKGEKKAEKKKADKKMDKKDAAANPCAAKAEKK